MATKYTKSSNTKICLLGASFETGNLGVSALAESSIKVILNRWPDAEIVLLGNDYRPHRQLLSIAGRKICVQMLPVRFSKNVFLPYHFLWFVLYGLLSKVLPWTRAKEILFSSNPYVRTLYETDLAVDITGGDSFSDIYGFKRFFLGTMRKWLVVLFGKRLVMMPQTYGPFRKMPTRVMAKRIMRHASMICSRDRAGMEFAENLFNIHELNGKIKFVPDVAFVLDSQKPGNLDVGSLFDVRAVSSVVVGLNVSGLLYCGGYTRNNMFGLRSNYRELIYAVIEMLLKNEGVSVLLIPHVFTPAGYEVESDPEACQKMYEQLRQIYSGRIFLVQGEYNQNEIKYIIGLCDFFIGSRMHACIAALSQCISAVGLAYSKKFSGVFESVGVKELVVDMRRHNQDEILAAIDNAFEKRQAVAERLRRTIPEAQATILNMFKDFEL